MCVTSRPSRPIPSTGTSGRSRASAGTRSTAASSPLAARPSPCSTPASTHRIRTSPASSWPARRCSTAPTARADPNGHGTAMAGIVAAATDNGIGIAGVGYAGVKVMPVTRPRRRRHGPGQRHHRGRRLRGRPRRRRHPHVVQQPGLLARPCRLRSTTPGRTDVVVVAATGNDGSSTATFPAGDRGVIGVSSTDFNDALDASSQLRRRHVPRRPGRRDRDHGDGGGNTTVTGTSASAAEVAGAAALLRASSFGASNGVIVGRLARNADPAGTADQTGNGRAEPGARDRGHVDGVDPAGGRGAGRRRRALRGAVCRSCEPNGQLQGQDNPPCGVADSVSVADKQLMGWAELRQPPSGSGSGRAARQQRRPGSQSTSIAPRGAPQASRAFSSQSDIERNDEPDYVLVDDERRGATPGPTRSRPACPTTTLGAIISPPGSLAGAHKFTGASLQVKGAGRCSFIKPAAGRERPISR